MTSELAEWIFGRCRACGSGGARICDRCLEILEHRRAQSGLWSIDDMGLPFPVRSIFRWDQDDSESDDRLRAMILSSKEIPSPDLVQLWSGLLAGYALRSRAGFSCIVNPPGRSGAWESDHSGAIAAAMGVALGIPIFKSIRRCLGTSDRASARPSRQKEAGRGNRLATVLGAKESVPGGERWLFFDDVIATGGTAQSVWTALGKPKHFEAWAIASRSRQR